MPGHTFETFKDLGLQGTTFKPRVPPVRVPVRVRRGRWPVRRTPDAGRRRRPFMVQDKVLNYLHYTVYQGWLSQVVHDTRAHAQLTITPTAHTDHGSLSN